MSVTLNGLSRHGCEVLENVFTQPEDFQKVFREKGGRGCTSNSKDSMSYQYSSKFVEFVRKAVKQKVQNMVPRFDT